MILHVTFSDGSNPWISLPADRHTIAKLWRQWIKNHPETARPCIISGNYCVMQSVHIAGSKGEIIDPASLYSVYRNNRKISQYKHLGHALQALERLGGGGA